MNVMWVSHFYLIRLCDRVGGIDKLALVNCVWQERVMGRRVDNVDSRVSFTYNFHYGKLHDLLPR